MRAEIVVSGASDKVCVIDTLRLSYNERHLRRKTVELTDGTLLHVDLPSAVVLGHNDCLQTESGALVRIEAAEEPLFEVRGQDKLHLAQLCWHIGNRHLQAQIEPERVLILRDEVIRNMLEGLGAEVSECRETFSPVRGAYHSHSHREL